MLYTPSKTISWMFKVEIYAIWRLYGLLMSFSLTAPHDTSKLKHTAEVQMEEHNNKMTEKEAVLPIIFLQVEVKQYLIGRWNAHQS